MTICRISVSVGMLTAALGIICSPTCSAYSEHLVHDSCVDTIRPGHTPLMACFDATCAFTRCWIRSSGDRLSVMVDMGVEGSEILRARPYITQLFS